MEITKIISRQIIDSRGNPTVETDVFLDNVFMGRAAVPSGASTGTHEALELRDGDETNYHGQSVLKAVGNVNNAIAQALVGQHDLSQEALDKILIDLDGTEFKKNLGANAVLSVSLAYAWAVSKLRNIQLFEYIGEIYGNTNFILPRPMFNIMNGGKHANWATDFQEYMVIPARANSWSESLKIGSEIFHSLEEILKTNNYSTNVGNEGGFAPDVKSNEEALQLIIQAIEKSGYILGEDVLLGFDAAASEFFNSETGNYELKKDDKVLSKAEMVDFVVELSNKYPLGSLEDMLSEDDWDSWKELTSRIGDRIQVVGDDLLVTNVKRVEKAIAEKTCNALLVKVNQIGTLTEALSAMRKAQNAGWKNVVSHRSGETEDVTIAHLVVGTGCGQIKSGAPSRGERTAKYNELLRIEEYLKTKS
jgi:enolase